MKRIIKAAVAVAVCGLAAAVAVPAQADTSVRVDGSGIVESFGVKQAAGLHNLPPFAERVSLRTDNELADRTLGPAASATGGSLLNGQDLATVTQSTEAGGPYEEVDRFVKWVLGISPKEVYEATTGEEYPTDNPIIDVADLVDADSDSDTAAASREGMRSRKDAAEEGRTGPRLAPVVREVAPVEAAPIADTLPGLVNAVSLDEIAPLVDASTDVVDNNTNRVVSSAGETQGGVAESVAQTTDLHAED
ncbi:hypothetical protein [Nonomuraea sp. NPDC003804]|uniref:hypothetical protein n=1 Tax=Nonomuraea sp. NPDC003804 TaxID=3154547 RepID=UPI0033A60501